MDIRSLYEIFRHSDGVCTDTRRIEKDKLFFALRGATFDGNAFARQAVEQGAKAAVVDSPEIFEANRDLGERIILAESVLQTLQDLAAEHRRRLAIPVLGIVGSNGKTTTKELVTCVLKKKFRVFATVGNLNNHIGVPLTLLSMDPSTQFGVVEMGASSCGEIASLCRISQPDFGLITNIGRAHLEGFGGEEGVRRGKGELFDYLAAKSGTAFVPDEDPVLNDMAAERKGLLTEHYSRSIADNVPSSLSGEYNHSNIAAAMAVGRYFGIDRQSLIDAVGAYTPTNNRSQEKKTELNELIVDCYNANPSSMESSIENMGDHDHPSKVLILGDMLELGKWSAEEHRHILDLAMATQHEMVITVGREFGKAAATLPDPSACMCFDTTDDLISWIGTAGLRNKLILIKGSHGMALERIISLL